MLSFYEKGISGLPMDLKTYINPLIKWWWLLLTAGIIAAVSSYLVTRQQPPVYQARSSLIIGRAVFDPNPTSTDLWLSQQLASFYSDLAQREPVRDATMKALGIAWLPQYLAYPVPNSAMLDIIVTDTSPERAQVVANELANQLVKQSPTSKQSGQASHQDFINQQLANLEKEINKTNDDITKRQEELSNLISARQIAEAQADITALATKRTTLQSNYAALLASSEQGAVNTLSIIERASLPISPVGPRKTLMIILTTMVGLVLAAAGAYVIEYLDNTIKSADEVTRLLNLPVVGNISEVRKSENEGLYVAKQPRSLIAESYRTLRTNLEFAAVDRPLKTILITSTGVSEGKTSVATNLAVVMAQGGKNVVLIDADLRRPNVHEALSIPNQRGLSDLFLGQLDLEDVLMDWEIDCVKVITSGSLPPNPADLLGSKKMDTILETLASRFDLVIIDSAPFLVTDAYILSGKTDGVLIVVRHGFSRREEVKAVVERLRHSGAHILGIVLNRAPVSTGGYSGYYGYYSSANEKAAKSAYSEKSIPVTGIKKWVSLGLFSKAWKGLRGSPKKAEPPAVSENGDGKIETGAVTVENEAAAVEAASNDTEMAENEPANMAAGDSNGAHEPVPTQDDAT
jgi:polysaccharide biosynthesis transport protein